MDHFVRGKGKRTYFSIGKKGGLCHLYPTGKEEREKKEKVDPTNLVASRGRKAPTLVLSEKRKTQLW